MSRIAEPTNASAVSAGRWRLSRTLLIAEWRSHPIRTALAMLTIALGVALGFSVQLINGAAYREFSAAARALSGQADLQVRGTLPTISERWYPQVAALPSVDVASPVLEIDATVPPQNGSHSGPSNGASNASSNGSSNAPPNGSLKILAGDVFQASRITPELLGVPDPSRPLDSVADNTVFLSTAAQTALKLRTGDRLILQAGSRSIDLRVAGGLLHARSGQRLGVMDIAAAQWRFGMVGRLTRIDVKLRDGADVAAFRRQFADLLARDAGERSGRIDDTAAAATSSPSSAPGAPASLLITQPSDDDSRTDRLSRAYRINMNVLALVALFTGAFLVLSTQASSVIRRRSPFALLRVIGWTRRQLLRHVLFEGLVLGVAGSFAGLAIGYGLAWAALRLFGSDLGGGYFPGVAPTVQVDPVAGAIFLVLGIAVALLGSLAPALEAARAAPATALKAGSEERVLRRLSPPWPGIASILTAVVLTQLPPLFDIPIFGYAAVALLLIGGIALMPRVTGWSFAWLAHCYRLDRPDHPAHTSRRPDRRAPRRPNAIASLALARLANAPGQTAIAMGGVLSSFALIVAMAVMVGSFRLSVEDWLSQLLSADLYVSVAGNGNTGGLTRSDQTAIAALPGVRHAAFTRVSSLMLDPRQPPVAILAREIDPGHPDRAMQMTDIPRTGVTLKTGDMPVWVSEAMVDLYGYRPGRRLLLPIGTVVDENAPQSATPPIATFVVAGVWRDYVRQTGAIQMRLSDYRRLTGDQTATEVAIDVGSAASTDQVVSALRQLPFGGLLHFAQPGEIRARTLTIFDRSFAVTYLLETVAIVIGLFGVAATFSAQTLARSREFGMLRHIGVTRRQVLAVLALEGGMLTLLGIGMGCLLGFGVSLILVFVVNPQSFHWTMSLHVPWRMIGAVALTMLLCSTMTALVAGRKAVSIDAVRAVREDW